MKTSFVVVAILLVASCMAPPSGSKKLIGSWQMVSMKFTYPNGRVVERKEFKTPSLKMYNELHYSFGRQNDNTGDIDDAGGGKYKVVGDTLISIPDYHTVPSFIGKPTKFHI